MRYNKSFHLSFCCVRYNSIINELPVNTASKVISCIWVHVSTSENNLQASRAKYIQGIVYDRINPLTPNDHCIGRTAPLTSKRSILYIYSTNIGPEYFKHCIYFLFFSLKNAVCFIILTYLVPVLFAFYIQGVLKLKKKIIPAPKG